MQEIIKMFLEYPVLAVLVIPGTLKQLRMWHLGYLDRKPSNKD
ncbi:hypothetical protein BUY00_01640 [Staphylococcus chromogenes]|nr:hypothetical protein BU641_04825 [Staphylococcus chromogenes]PUZ23548.1 hypothetical protein BUY00_01640 [Staphylococcus chromogenes]QDW82151.1 hypothetical protein DWB92_05160 [Staphylococcus chromogenes]TJY13770.1 hypothetical protein FCF12_11545 [Staphylococcus chromogenes]TRL29920.1 hypothetical protein FNL21_04365 [Staphylococcus chromogenes]